VVDSIATELSIATIPVVCEYPNVFLEESPSTPQHRKVDFYIDLTLRVALKYKAPCRMATLELKELRNSFKRGILGYVSHFREHQKYL